MFKLNSHEFCPTASRVDDILKNIGTHVPYKPINGLNISKPCELELTLVEILNPKKTIVIVACMYSHSNV